MTNESFSGYMQEIPLLKDLRPNKFTEKRPVFSDAQVLEKEWLRVGEIYTPVHITELLVHDIYPSFELISDPFEFIPDEWHIEAKTIINLPFDNRRIKTPSLLDLGVEPIKRHSKPPIWNQHDYLLRGQVTTTPH